MIVTVDRDRFLLELWVAEATGVGYARRRRFKVATGRLGSATPRGVYGIVAKTREPAWDNPKTPEYDPIDYRDPDNPFAGGFLSLSGGGGYGIHGTKFDPQVGSRASAGCVRMQVEDFLRIYDQIVPGETAVVIL